MGKYRLCAGRRRSAQVHRRQRLRSAACARQHPHSQAQPDPRPHCLRAAGAPAQLWPRAADLWHARVRPGRVPQAAGKARLQGSILRGRRRGSYARSRRENASIPHKLDLPGDVSERLLVFPGGEEWPRGGDEDAGGARVCRGGGAGGGDDASEGWSRELAGPSRSERRTHWLPAAHPQCASLLCPTLTATLSLSVRHRRPQHLCRGGRWVYSASCPSAHPQQGSKPVSALSQASAPTARTPSRSRTALTSPLST